MPKLQTNFFWTDHIQASERLTGTYVLLENDPIYVREVVPSTSLDDLCPEMVFIKSGTQGRGRVRLDDPRFSRFRKLPVLGWVNSEKLRKGVLLERRPVRNRQHGLSDTSVVVGQLYPNRESGRDSYQIHFNNDRPRFSDIASEDGYASACNGKYPALADVITHIREESTIAISPIFAVHRDELGIRWLYRLSHRVALISGADSLLLLNKYKFLREELTEDPAISVQNIREF